MDFFQVVKTRQSIRAFAARDIEEEKLRQILDAANKAPSAGNLQAYEIFLVRDASVRKELARASLRQDFIASAPISLVFCANPFRAAARYGQRGEQLYSIQDATIACTFAMLAATANGLATVWIGAFSEEKVRQAISVPEGLRPVAILPIGYAAETPQPTSRRLIAELVHTA
jgi:nitroreductase